MENLQLLKHCFNSAGFPLVGVVDFEAALPLYQQHVERYRAWLARGAHARMGYLERGMKFREDPRALFPALKSVIAFARPYDVSPSQSQSLKYARYLRNRDYHQEMLEGAERALRRMVEENLIPKDAQTKVCVDTSAVLERAWSEICGLGWIGKNTLLIHPKLGSFTFLGVIFTDVSFGAQPNLLPNYCGNCTRCISDCPTQALGPQGLESSKCIAYRTLEHRGPWEDDLDHQGYLAGCDICQEVCPFNRKVLKELGHSSGQLDPALSHDEQLLVEESREDYRKRVSESALKRVKYDDFKRNLHHVLRTISPK